jgi:hypothetical protein
MPNSKTYCLSWGEDLVYGSKCLIGNEILILFPDVYFAYWDTAFGPRLFLSTLQNAFHNDPYDHIVNRVLGFFYSRPNWDPPPLPQPAGECVLHFGLGGGTIACGRGGGWAPIWSRGQTLWCSYVLCAYDSKSQSASSDCKAESIKKCVYFPTADFYTDASKLGGRIRR